MYARLSLGTLILASMTMTMPLLVGCGNAEQPPADDAPRVDDPHAHDDLHDAPLTEQEIEALRQASADYVAAIQQIRSLRDEIRTAAIGSTPAEAHRALDQLDLVLDWLPAVARDSGVPRRDWEQINVTARRLRALFDALHMDIDAGKRPDYQASAEAIDRAIDTLGAIEPEPNL